MDKGQRDLLLKTVQVFLSHQWPKSITKPQELMAQLFRKSRVRMCELAGCDFICNHLPITLTTGKLTKEALEQLFRENKMLPFALDNYLGQISIHAPANKLFNSEFKLIPKEKQSRRPLKALTVFTDASGASYKSVMTWKEPQTQQWETDVEEVEGPPQITELPCSRQGFWEIFRPVQSGDWFGICSRGSVQGGKCCFKEGIKSKSLWAALKTNPCCLPPRTAILCDACDVTYCSACIDCRR